LLAYSLPRRFVYWPLRSSGCLLRLHYSGLLAATSQYFCRSEDAGVGTPEQGVQEEKAPEEEEEEEAEGDGGEGEKGPVDYNALDYETMDGAGSEKDEDKIGKSNTVTAPVKKPEPEAEPAGNDTVEEEVVTKIIAKEKSQGTSLRFCNLCIMFV
jgi:hypothetical protein